MFLSTNSLSIVYTFSREYISISSHIVVCPLLILQAFTNQNATYREGGQLCWWTSCSNSLWQGWSWGLVHCPSGNATWPIWRVLASSLGISSRTPLKPQHCNPNPLANQLWCIDFLTPPTPLIIPHRLPAFLESLMPLKNSCSIHARWSKKQSEAFHAFLWHF